MDETRQNIKKSLLQLIVYFYLGLYDYSVLVTPIPMCVYTNVCLPLTTWWEPFTCLTYVCRQQSDDRFA